MAGAGGAVEGVDGSVFIGGQGEAEQVEILPLTVGMHGLGDDDRAVFDVPAQNHLGRADLMGGGDLLDGAVAGVEVGATRHRRVGLHGDAVLLAERLRAAATWGAAQSD